MRALIIDRVSEVIATGLRERGVEVDIKILPAVDELKELLPDYDLLIMRVDPKIGREVLDAAAKRVKMIAVCSTGTNHIDLEYAAQLGIRILNAPGINCNAVAELTISKMLDLSRFTMEGDREVQEERIWNKYKYTGHELKGHVLGLVGLGKIGSRVAHLAQAFDMKVLAYDPYVDAAAMEEKGVTKIETLGELCAASDYISAHTPLTDETRGMISTKEFEQMRDGTILINCARGGVVDESAAKAALTSGRLAGFSTDVLENELAGKGLGDNAKLESELFGSKGFTVSPHIGGSTHEAYDGIGEHILSGVVEFYGLDDKVR
ncbi:NAD(P)-dependent oxidoreductase [[Clostridium] symbiosum]|uniref:NAD(P)-dependent oxidoreductase n=1 Tax=Clostridium symbiosum TaxID=1512 RepID=UPI001D0842AD|nr:NAD(P)-dependent oxidoreductase [[Clostridium] symbiosum]MCB6607911.1 NAD(P)-binding domain-containing protein [[Clostridium] symbiosum]MCB6930412.1 NAD(P)-binding domain-containing protein [[Clostridium] symbiosum]